MDRSLPVSALVLSLSLPRPRTANADEKRMSNSFGAYLLTLVMDLWPAYKTRELGWRRRPHPQSDPAAIERRRILKSVGEKNGPNGEAVNDRAQPVMRDLAETPQPSASVVGEA